MSKMRSRRSFIKQTLKMGLLAAGSSTGIYTYSHHLEPKMVNVVEHTIKHAAIPKGFDGFKIIQFSDTHLGFHYDLKQFDKLISKINDLQPDLVLFTGDLMDEPNKYETPQLISPILNKLKAPFGKFAIYGNHDHGGYGTDLYYSIMKSANFITLKNQSHKLTLLDGSHIYILGLDDAMLGRPDFPSMMAGIPSETYKLLLCHEPDLAEQAQSHGIHFQLSGHSHGGQIQIPFYGPLVTPPLAEKYHQGFYYLENGLTPLTLYVNRGIGTTRLPFRFLSFPEITVFQLTTP